MIQYAFDALALYENGPYSVTTQWVSVRGVLTKLP